MDDSEPACDQVIPGNEDMLGAEEQNCNEMCQPESETSFRKQSRSSSPHILGQEQAISLLEETEQPVVQDSRYEKLESRRSSQQSVHGQNPQSRKSSQGKALDKTELMDERCWISEKTGIKMISGSQQTSFVWGPETLEEILRPFHEAAISRAAYANTKVEPPVAQDSHHSIQQPEGQESRRASQQLIAQDSHHSIQQPEGQESRRASQLPIANESRRSIPQVAERKESIKGRQQNAVHESRCSIQQPEGKESRQTSQQALAEESYYITQQPKEQESKTGNQLPKRQGSYQMPEDKRIKRLKKMHRNITDQAQQTDSAESLKRELFEKSLQTDSHGSSAISATIELQGSRHGSRQSNLQKIDQESFPVQLQDPSSGNQPSEAPGIYHGSLPHELSSNGTKQFDVQDLHRGSLPAHLQHEVQEFRRCSLPLELQDSLRNSKQAEIQEFRYSNILAAVEDLGETPLEAEEENFQSSPPLELEVCPQPNQQDIEQDSQHDNQKPQETECKVDRETETEGPISLDGKTAPLKQKASFAQQTYSIISIEESTWLNRRSGKLIRNLSQQTDCSWLQANREKEKKLGDQEMMTSCETGVQKSTCPKSEKEVQAPAWKDIEKPMEDDPWLVRKKSAVPQKDSEVLMGLKSRRGSEMPEYLRSTGQPSLPENWRDAAALEILKDSEQPEFTGPEKTGDLSAVPELLQSSKQLFMLDSQRGSQQSLVLESKLDSDQPAVPESWMGSEEPVMPEPEKHSQPPTAPVSRRGSEKPGEPESRKPSELRTLPEPQKDSQPPTAAVSRRGSEQPFVPESRKQSELRTLPEPQKDSQPPTAAVSRRGSEQPGVPESRKPSELRTLPESQKDSQPPTAAVSRRRVSSLVCLNPGNPVNSGPCLSPRKTANHLLQQYPGGEVSSLLCLSPGSKVNSAPCQNLRKTANHLLQQCPGGEVSSLVCLNPGNPVNSGPCLSPRKTANHLLQQYPGGEVSSLVCLSPGNPVNSAPCLNLRKTANHLLQQCPGGEVSSLVCLNPGNPVNSGPCLSPRKTANHLLLPFPSGE
ncbi:Hypothetical predicted protein [Podarcis lilfordi]|uniref:Uncharacterized protein n=1 Tax=Podarcis lilfordi TaxID=74358 RepID=A0AA35NUQ8_9SAUR|nr:Hypothetical predicted protein [Podarcis lilfordi]